MGIHHLPGLFLVLKTSVLPQALTFAQLLPISVMPYLPPHHTPPSLLQKSLRMPKKRTMVKEEAILLFFFFF